MPVVMGPDFYLNIDLLSRIVGGHDAVGQSVVIYPILARWASAAGFVTCFPVQTGRIIFLRQSTILPGNIVARSRRFEEAVCVCCRRDGEDGKQDCHQTDRDGHGVRFVL